MTLIETPARIEPCGFEETIPEALSDRALEIRDAASDLGRGLHPESAVELRGLVRLMNAYYSNLIEGHNTRPADIEAAMAGGAVDPEKRPLIQEAIAHIAVQEWIDGLSDADALPEPCDLAFLQDIHHQFYQAMPDDLRFVTFNNQHIEIIPGAMRDEGREVQVGQHLPPSAHRLPDFMAYFSTRYRGLTRGKTGQILSIPAAHHRFNYIHPFLDGNGRVSRLMSHAMIQRAGIGGQGLWSISRGLARGLQESGEYKAQMASADSPRRGDRDGRGNLSMAALESFTGWFLTVMLDQIKFTSAIFDLGRLLPRYLALVRDVEPDDQRMVKLVDHVLRFGQMARGDAPMVLGVKERAARDTLSAAVEAGFLKSTTPKTPVRIAFPLQYRERLFPNLFSEAPLDIPQPPALPGNQVRS